MYKYILPLLFFLINGLMPVTQELNAQRFAVGGGLGLASYDGDLSVLKSKNRLKITHLAGSVSGIIEFHPRFSSKIYLTHTKLSGSDEYEESLARVSRNLSFFTKITEVGILINANLLEFGYYEDYQFTPYVFLGIGGFHFNPKAEFHGEIVELQPIGTEGQGLSAFPDRKPYKLNQVTVPFGLGMKFILNEYLIISIEGRVNKLFTDYLDDVSTTYPPFDYLLEFGGVNSAQLSNRSGEYYDTGPDKTKDNSQRGNTDKNDIYGVIDIQVHYLF
jgi:hypothetical protein